MAKPRSTNRQEKEATFVRAVEQLLGFHLMDWQRPVLIELLRDQQAGRPLNFSRIKKP